MSESEKDQLAEQVADLRIAFDLALSNKRKYPVQESKIFVQSERRHVEITASDPMVHKSVARAVNGLREFPQVEVNSWRYLIWADRLECQLFAGGDPKLDGDEPPDR